MDDVEVRELRYFIMVAEELNFTRAAARLGMAQPPLSAAIAKLERKLGVTLLERTSRRVTLTAAGALLLEQGRIAVDGVTAAVERTRRQGERVLTVAVKPGIGTDLLKTIMQRCDKEVRLLFGRDPAAAVRTGKADAAILRAPFDERGLDSEVLLVEPRVAMLSKDHRLAGRSELCRADLAGESMPRWAGHFDEAAAAYWAGGTSTGEALAGPEINDISQLLDAVALSDSVAYVPLSTAEEHGRVDLVFVPVTDVSPSTIVAAWPDTCHSRKVAAFVRAAAEVTG